MVCAGRFAIAENDLKDLVAKSSDWIAEQWRNKKYWNAKFHRCAGFSAKISGRPPAFDIAMILVVIWWITGPIFDFSDTWQLVINTATIITFLMVFLIQHTQNRDTDALKLKPDELLRAAEGANTALLDLEELKEEELEILHTRYAKLAREAGQIKPAFPSGAEN